MIVSMFVRGRVHLNTSSKRGSHDSYDSDIETRQFWEKIDFPSLQEMQQEMSAKRSDLSGLGALSESLCEGASPDDCQMVADKMAELKAVCEGVERDMGTRRRVLEDGMEQVSV